MPLAVDRNYFYLNQMAFCSISCPIWDYFTNSLRWSSWTYKPMIWCWRQFSVLDSSSEFSHFKLLSDISPPEKQEQMGGICHPRVGPPQPWSKQITLLIPLLFHNKSPFGVLPLVIKEASHACGCSQAVATAAEDVLLGGSAQLSPWLQSFY